MRTVYRVSDNIISSLGFSTPKNMDRLNQAKSGIKCLEGTASDDTPFYAAAIDNRRLAECATHLGQKEEFTRFEKLIILSVEDALKETDIRIDDDDTLIILCTTKGNIDQLGKANHRGRRIHLWESAKVIQKHFNHPNIPVVISNACISGLVGILTAARLLCSERYKTVIVSAGDIMSDFIISGFQSLKAVSPFPCKPYDFERQGLSLGEGAGTIVLTTEKEKLTGPHPITVLGGAVSSDAYHITRPARTAEGLLSAICGAMRDADLKPEEIDYISGHGTATQYNDEMESLAVSTAGLGKVPINSLKGYYGHTLGASGMIESIIATNSMRQGRIYGTKGFNKTGVTGNIKIVRRHMDVSIKNCLKIAAGFGGCNASVVFGIK